MKKRVAFWPYCLLALSLSCAASTGGGQGQEGAAGAVTETAYTSVNIWMERPDAILSTNYHRGTIIPAGTAVVILRRRGDQIQFRTDAGAVYKLIHAKRHSTIDLEELFRRNFSKENVMAPNGKFSRLSEMEKRNVKAGKVALGMSKDAVLMAYGYPPSHRTASPSEDTWIYWRDRIMNFSVHFGPDGRVNSLGGSAP